MLEFLAAVSLMLFGWLSYRANNRLEVTEYRVAVPDLPEAFEGFTIAHISDLHDKRFGRDERRLFEAVVEAGVDLCAVTGDIVANKREMPSHSLRLIERLAGVAPVYYVTGNHEAFHVRFEELMKRIGRAGAIRLSGPVSFAKDGAKITTLGVDDPAFFGEHRGEQIAGFRRALDDMHSVGDGGAARILLSHRPELADHYEELGFDLVLTGHAHGGVWRLPFVGGIFGPNRTLFPKYSEGIHHLDGTNLVVSRGLGPTTIPFRINNRPELVIVRLCRA